MTKKLTGKFYNFKLFFTVSNSKLFFSEMQKIMKCMFFHEEGIIFLSIFITKISLKNQQGRFRTNLNNLFFLSNQAVRLLKFTIKV